MTSNIDPTKPAGTEAFGAHLRANLAAAKDEIEALQAATSGNFNDLSFSATALTFASPTTWDVGDVPIAKLTLTGNTTLDASNVPEGQIAVLIITQEEPGGHSITWGTGFSSVDPIFTGMSVIYFVGTSDGLVMAQVRRASQADAEEGTSNARLMTPLRTAQAISAQIADIPHNHSVSDISDAGDLAGENIDGTAFVATHNDQLLTANAKNLVVPWATDVSGAPQNTIVFMLEDEA